MSDTGLKFFCYIITTHVSNLEVKVMVFEILSESFWLKFLEVYIFWSSIWILLILCLMLDTGLKFYVIPLRPTRQWPWPQGHRLRNFKLKLFVNWKSIFWSFIFLILCLILGTGLKLNAAPSLTNLEVKVTDFEILSWCFWLKFLELDYCWIFEWI